MRATRIPPACGVVLARRRIVRGLRAAECQYCPGWVTTLWLVGGVLALLYSGACHPAPVVDLGGKPPLARETITGIVRGQDATSGIPGRDVEVIDVATGEKQRVTTAANGGFTVQLPKGRYRLELQLRDGELLTRRPGIVDLDRGDIDSDIEFIVSPARSARRPSYRLDNGLGSPIA
jgi:hypothetical protein